MDHPQAEDPKKQLSQLQIHCQSKLLLPDSHASIPRVYRQDNSFTLWPTSFEKLQPFPHLIFPLLNLSTPNCPWIEKCKETNNVLKESRKQMTMDCLRPLLRLKTTRCDFLFLSCGSKTPCRRLDKGDRERSRGSGGAGVRRMHKAATTLTNSIGQLDQIELRVTLGSLIYCFASQQGSRQNTAQESNLEFI